MGQLTLGNTGFSLFVGRPVPGAGRPVAVPVAFGRYTERGLRPAVHHNNIAPRIGPLPSDRSRPVVALPSVPRAGLELSGSSTLRRHTGRQPVFSGGQKSR